MQCHGVAGFSTYRLRARAGAEQGISNDRNSELSGDFGADQGKNRWAKTGRETGRGRVAMHRRRQNATGQPDGSCGSKGMNGANGPGAIHIAQKMYRTAERPDLPTSTSCRRRSSRQGFAGDSDMMVVNPDSVTQTTEQNAANTATHDGANAPSGTKTMGGSQSAAPGASQSKPQRTARTAARAARQHTSRRQDAPRIRVAARWHNGVKTLIGAARARPSFLPSWRRVYGF